MLLIYRALRIVVISIGANPILKSELSYQLNASLPYPQKKLKYLPHQLTNSIAHAPAKPKLRPYILFQQDPRIQSSLTILNNHH